MLNESEIIQSLKQTFPEHIGDDAAILPYTDEESYLISKDLLVEDIHFRCRYQSPESLARKALEVNLSDIAAMGGTPKFVLLGISIPESYEVSLAAFLRSFSEACLKHQVLLIGGDTIRSSDKLSLSITVIGTIISSHVKYRHTAKPGDWIGFIGNLGYAHLGLMALEQKLPGFESFKTKFLDPKARLNEGTWLGEQPEVNAMMDVSDGLLIDLERLAKSSHLAAEIELSNLAVNDDFEKSALSLGLDPQMTQLTGGEDYGLLVTMDSKKIESLQTSFETQFEHKILILGQMKKGFGLHFLEKGLPKNLIWTPFSHFGER